MLTSSPVSLQFSRQYHGRRYQTFWLLTKRKPALVIRALQLVLQESIGDTAVMSDGNIGGGTRSL
jgi:hypothetical protein